MLTKQVLVWYYIKSVRTADSFHDGEMSERFKEPVLKTGDVQASVGSNPTLSATSLIRYRDLQKYPRGRRGSPAKGVGWIKPARGFKSLLLRQSPQAQAACGGFLYFGADVVINVRGTSEEERIALIKKETHGRARISSANAWAVPRHSRRGCGTCARPVCIWSRVTSWNAVKRPKSACMRSAPTTCASSA